METTYVTPQVKLKSRKHFWQPVVALLLSLFTLVGGFSSAFMAKNNAVEAYNGPINWVVCWFGDGKEDSVVVAAYDLAYTDNYPYLFNSRSAVTSGSADVRDGLNTLLTLTLDGGIDPTTGMTGIQKLNEAILGYSLDPDDKEDPTGEEAKDTTSTKVTAFDRFGMQGLTWSSYGGEWNYTQVNVCDDTIVPKPNVYYPNRLYPQSTWDEVGSSLDVRSQVAANKTEVFSNAITNNIANGIFSVTKLIVTLTISLLGLAFSDLVSTMGLTDLIASDTGIFYKLYNGLYLPLVILMFILVGTWLIWQGLVKKQYRKGLGGVVKSIALFMLAVIVAINPTFWISLPNSIAVIGQSVLVNATSSAITASDGICSVDSTNTYKEVKEKDPVTGEYTTKYVVSEESDDLQDTEKTQSLLEQAATSMQSIVGCELWYNYAFRPWVLGQFGTEYDQLYAKTPEGGTYAEAADGATVANDNYKWVGDAAVPMGGGYEIHNWALFQLSSQTNAHKSMTAAYSGSSGGSSMDSAEALNREDVGMPEGWLGFPGYVSETLTMTPEKTRILNIILDTTKEKGLTAQDAVIAVMTAITESRLENPAGGDGSSVGTFQQTPEGGYNMTCAADTECATGMFLDKLVKNVGEKRYTNPPWATAQNVQLSYANNEPYYGFNYKEWYRAAVYLVQENWDGDLTGVVYPWVDGEEGGSLTSTNSRGAYINGTAADWWRIVDAMSNYNERTVESAIPDSNAGTGVDYSAYGSNNTTSITSDNPDPTKLPLDYWSTWNGSNPNERVAMALGSILPAMIGNLAPLVFAGMSAIYGFSIAIAMAFAPLFLLIGLFPGRGWEAFKSWLQLVGNLMMKRIMAGFMLVLSLIFITSILHAAQDQNYWWGVAMVLVVSVALFKFRHAIFDMLSGLFTFNFAGGSFQDTTTGFFQKGAQKLGNATKKTAKSGFAFAQAGAVGTFKGKQMGVGGKEGRKIALKEELRQQAQRNRFTMLAQNNAAMLTKNEDYQDENTRPEANEVCVYCGQYLKDATYQTEFVGGYVQGKGWVCHRCMNGENGPAPLEDGAEWRQLEFAPPTGSSARKKEASPELRKHEERSVELPEAMDSVVDKILAQVKPGTLVFVDPISGTRGTLTEAVSAAFAVDVRNRMATGQRPQTPQFLEPYMPQTAREQIDALWEDGSPNAIETIAMVYSHAFVKYQYDNGMRVGEVSGDPDSGPQGDINSTYGSMAKAAADEIRTLSKMEEE